MDSHQDSQAGLQGVGLAVIAFFESAGKEEEKKEGLRAFDFCPLSSASLSLDSAGGHELNTENGLYISSAGYILGLLRQRMDLNE